MRLIDFCSEVGDGEVFEPKDSNRNINAFYRGSFFQFCGTSFLDGWMDGWIREVKRSLLKEIFLHSSHGGLIGHLPLYEESEREREKSCLRIIRMNPSNRLEAKMNSYNLLGSVFLTTVGSRVKSAHTRTTPSRAV